MPVKGQQGEESEVGMGRLGQQGSSDICEMTGSQEDGPESLRNCSAFLLGQRGGPKVKLPLNCAAPFRNGQGLTLSIIAQSLLTVGVEGRERVPCSLQLGTLSLSFPFFFFFFSFSSHFQLQFTFNVTLYSCQSLRGGLKGSVAGTPPATPGVDRGHFHMCQEVSPPAPWRPRFICREFTGGMLVGSSTSILTAVCVENKPGPRVSQLSTQQGLAA